MQQLIGRALALTQAFAFAAFGALPSMTVLLLLSMLCSTVSLSLRIPWFAELLF